MMAQTKLFRWLFCSLTISLLLSALLPGAALANGGDEGMTVVVDGYQLSLVFAQQAKVGENSLHLQILDGMGMPVSGAQVQLSAMPVEDTPQHQADMENTQPAMSGMNMDAATATPVAMSGMNMDAATATPVAMSGMNMDAATATPESMSAMPDIQTSALVAGDAAGEYAGQLTFAASGHWMVAAHITLNGHALDAEFPVTVVAGSSGPVVLAGFAGFNLVLIVIAAILKRKQA
jgi:hypothetical protein